MKLLSPPPAFRRLRIFTFDPSLSSYLETAGINEITIPVVWEKNLRPGPIGEYLEVIDYDPASNTGYFPVDLNDPNLLALDGVAPSESNPQFHQQMVYAVAMTTINQFERALGRVAFWTDKVTVESGEMKDYFVRRLRLYPHAIRDRNAYYSPSKKAILFGYFPVTFQDKHNTPGTVVFTCLSHDIIAHEVTHALLDGVHPRFNEPTNPDVLAFHEAFSDIVALFQHFSYPSVLEHQISRTRGDLESESLLGQLAQQFGKATGRGAALRDALGGINESTGEWEMRKPDPHVLSGIFEPHDRGAILVAAIFRAFLVIYRARTSDLFRIAAGNNASAFQGELHPDLTKRLAAEASKCADRVLQMCIRGIDYCPPVDITFGNYLRAVITADLDFAPADEGSYRVAFIQSFREWGIYPGGIRSLGVESLAWPSGEEKMHDLLAKYNRLHEEGKYKGYLKDNLLSHTNNWGLESDRLAVWESLSLLRAKLWTWLMRGDHFGQGYAELFGLITDNQAFLAPPTVYRTKSPDGSIEPAVEIHSARPTLRRTLRGALQTDLVIEITQRRRGYFDPEEQKRMDEPGVVFQSDQHGDFIYRSGCTIMIDTTSQEVRRIIRTAGTISDDDELERVRKFLCGDSGSSGNAFDAGIALSMRSGFSSDFEEPFALLHMHQSN
ncbi:hypothetical protein SAMN05216327_109193 [Dyadobacter sp. SG02]|uniref:hypothetical protein n=1 Tax=Dyadobacter sp. SG02 TaxID=1855291 RepID=UPI0008C3D384|nr:hypothetical protein [Dyadobacter sp. SG02]SEJ38950.1 hypothetical protein SAMN05216327_109193 [Dyadobacter sp. SG02]